MRLVSPDLHLRPRDADGSDAERHRPLLLGEDVLDPGADLRAGGIAAADMRCHRPSLRLAVVDLAAEAVPVHEGFVRPRAIGAVGPDGGAGVRSVEKAATEHPPIVPAASVTSQRRMKPWRRSMLAWLL